MPALISVIVPCFNYGHLLAQTLRSIQAQTTKDWECVIVDDGSTDETSIVAAHFKISDSRILYVRQENRGMSNARNVGIQSSTGKYIQLLDSDDLIEPGKLEAQATYLENNPEVDLVYGKAEFFNHIETNSSHSSFASSHKRWLPQVSGADCAVLQHIVRDNFVVVSAPLFKRELVLKNGLFDESLKFHEDWEFWLRHALGNARFQFLDAKNAGTLIRVHNKSVSSNRLEMCKSNLVIRRHLETRLSDKQLKAINFERSLSMLLEVTRIMAKSDFLSAMQYGINNWPRADGFIPALDGIRKFLLVTLKTSRFAKNLKTRSNRA